MEKEFVTYEQALALKELGSDIQCFKMSEHRKACSEQEESGGCQLHNLHCGYPDCTIDRSVTPIPLPTYSQAFRWFRSKHDLDFDISKNEKVMIDYVKGKGETHLPKYRYGYTDDSYHAIGSSNSYEEAESVCLDKLIEIVKNN